MAMHTVFSEYKVRQQCRLDRWDSNGLVVGLLLLFTTHMSRAVSVACPPPSFVQQPNSQGILSPISPSWLWGRRRLDDKHVTARPAIYRRVSSLPAFPEKYATIRRASVPLTSRVFLFPPHPTNDRRCREISDTQYQRTKVTRVRAHTCCTTR